jgi:ABC-type multidrug transport system fused ATPase/permease subunit
LSPATRWRLAAAALAMAGITVVEGVALALLVPLLQLLTSADFSATSGMIERLADLTDRRGSALAGLLAVAVAVVYVVKGVASIVVLRWSTGFAMAEEARLAEVLTRSYLGAPLHVHFHRNSAEFQRTINQSLRSTFGQAFVAGFSSAADLLGVLVIGAVLVVSAPQLAALGIGYFALVVVVYQRVVSERLKRASRHIHDDQARVFRDVQQALSAVKEVKAGAVEETFVRSVADSRRSMLSSYRTIALLAVQPRYVFELAMVGAAVLVSIVAYTSMAPDKATASIAVFMAGGFRMLAPVSKVFTGINQVRAAQPAIEQIRDDLVGLRPLADEQLAESVLAPPIEPRLSLSSVDFAYVESVPILRGVDLELSPGESIGIVGGSGAGKSTIVDLVMGLIEPTGGSITVDGSPLRDVRRSWQRSIAYVPQSVTLLDGDVRANVAFGLPDDDDEAVWRALRSAQLDDVVSASRDGLATKIGERGVLLSGGQRQRLGIARALFRRPTLLVLDEATSSLDNETEAKLTEVLQSLRGEVTTIAIAHRLSTVREVDRLYYLAGGRVVDVGSFDELYDRVPDFARLVELSAVPVAGAAR